ncbi:MAG: glycosyltransferase family 1 protein [Tannerellaceae bacterium]|jgi:hypothetical protein|nr:glycosyltransferase family 1 protein [Tannerellaceae bacterium]
MEKHLHIIALNIPYPPNYGGVIDIYYKLEALSRMGVKITLHCFEYDRRPAPCLDDLCEKVFYYRRRTGLMSNFSLLPYNVFSRKSPALMQNLLSDDYPILFEGLHSCYYLTDPRLSGRVRIYRAGNIEHDYYRLLARSCRRPLTRAFLSLEAWRFRRYERVIASADVILAISLADEAYFRSRFPGRRVCFMPAFHAAGEVTARTGGSGFALYHGKLSVFENERVALFLIRKVFRHLGAPCVLAGMDPSERILSAAAPYPDITIVANPSDDEMNRLVREAQVHLLVTFQDTGLKLKLLNSLFSGRHVVVNRLMLAGSGLDALCHVADTPEEMIGVCRLLLSRPFTESDIDHRRTLLLPFYTSSHQAALLLEMI